MCEFIVCVSATHGGHLGGVWQYSPLPLFNFATRLEKTCHRGKSLGARTKAGGYGKNAFLQRQAVRSFLNYEYSYEYEYLNRQQQQAFICPRPLLSLFARSDCFLQSSGKIR
jgi:hypothetical protein